MGYYSKINIIIPWRKSGKIHFSWGHYSLCGNTDSYKSINKPINLIELNKYVGKYKMCIPCKRIIVIAMQEIADAYTELF